MFVFNAIVHALQISLFMLWEVLWPLAFGFLLSAMIQTVVSKRAVAGALGKPDLKGFFLACGFGAASSSCSYAAVAVGRALFRRGASFVNAIIFEFAATNLVFNGGTLRYTGATAQTTDRLFTVSASSAIDASGSVAAAMAPATGVATEPAAAVARSRSFNAHSSEKSVE